MKFLEAYSKLTEPKPLRCRFEYQRTAVALESKQNRQEPCTVLNAELIPLPVFSIAGDAELTSSHRESCRVE